MHEPFRFLNVKKALPVCQAYAVSARTIERPDRNSLESQVISVWVFLSFVQSRKQLFGIDSMRHRPVIYADISIIEYFPFCHRSSHPY